MSSLEPPLIGAVPQAAAGERESLDRGAGAFGERLAAARDAAARNARDRSTWNGEQDATRTEIDAHYLTRELRRIEAQLAALSSTVDGPLLRPDGQPADPTDPRHQHRRYESELARVESEARAVEARNGERGHLSYDRSELESRLQALRYDLARIRERLRSQARSA